ncbi:MAG: DUF6311 domain-containing protein [Polyangiales bacterium]
MAASDSLAPSPTRAWLRAHGAEIAAIALATGWFLWLGHGATLLPTRITWMLRYDWAAALWGFSFFRNAPLTWPLGSAPDLFHPFGTSVGFTDACPWAALLFRLLSPLLPSDFQYFGLWFWLCYVLQALVGTRITALSTDDRVQQALGGFLFALTPLLPARHAHAALCGLFFVSAGLYLHLAPVRDAAAARKLVKLALVLSAWAAGTHGYLSVMLLALVLGMCARLALVERRLGMLEAALAALAAVLVSVLVYALFGYIGWRPTALTAEGFGDFSADLNALVNPQGWSRWLRALPHQPRQWEGFGYLGCGVLALLALRLGLWLAAPRAALRALVRSWPLLLVVLAFTTYALSSRVAWNGIPVLDLERAYAGLTQLTGVFRSSGRFVWLLHLTLLAAAISAAARLFDRRLGRVLLLGAATAQAIELDPSRLDFSPVALAEPPDPVWQTVGRSYRHLVLKPLHLLWVCRYDERLVHQLSYLAYHQKLSFNSGNFMRMQPQVEALCERGFAPGEPLNPDTIYVIDPALRPQLEARGARCGVLDGLLTCVSGERMTPLHDALLRHPA